MKSRQAGEYLTDREADEAATFIRQNRDMPFFLNLCHYAVHTPLQARESLVQKFESKKPTNQRSPVYAAMVQSVDEALGRIRESLLELGLEKETLIIFTSDNGGLLMEMATSNEPLRLGKGYPYEGGIRIPAIFCWPGRLPSGVVLDNQVISMDLFPTLCDVAGISLQEGIPMDGINLMPLMEYGTQLKRQSLFWHFPHYRGQDISPYSIIRRGDWKLIRRYEGELSELYNLGNDLSETSNLSEEHPDLVRSLEEELDAWLESVDAKMPLKKQNPESAPLSGMDQQ
jgi:arylsulfatase A-like enzyme